MKAKDNITATTHLTVNSSYSLSVFCLLHTTLRATDTQHSAGLLTHGALLHQGVLVFEGVVGELRAVVRWSVSIIAGAVEADRAVTCDTQTQRVEEALSHTHTHYCQQQHLFSQF